MMSHPSHTIQQQSIEIHFEEMDKTMGVQDRIADLFYTRLQPQMEILFNEIAGDNYRISLESLKIDCGVLSNKLWENEWVDVTLRKLREELLMIPRKIISKEETNSNAEEAFFCFLEYGYLPWNVTEVSVKTLEERLHISPSFLAKLKALMRENETVIQRLLNSSTGSFREKLIVAFAKENNTDWQAMQTIYQKIGESQEVFFEAALQAIADETENPILPFLRHLHHTSNATIEKKIEGVASELNIRTDQLNLKVQSLKKEKEPEPIFIFNAGLVLLHPFLPQLFELTGLAKKNEWIDETSQHKAVKILHYLVTGNDEWEESSCSLTKIICGLKPSAVVYNYKFLTEEMKEACQTMLGEVIGHWKALKNTGIETFRETFLRRTGKLSLVDDGWLLRVEQKSVDVLLNYLPWGIGIIKLPWMKEMVYVEWG